MIVNDNNVKIWASLIASNPDGDFVNNSGIFYQYLSGDWTAECWFRTPAGNAARASTLFALQGYNTGFGYYPYFDIAVK